VSCIVGLIKNITAIPLRIYTKGGTFDPISVHNGWTPPWFLLRATLSKNNFKRKLLYLLGYIVFSLFGFGLRNQKQTFSGISKSEQVERSSSQSEKNPADQNGKDQMRCRHLMHCQSQILRPVAVPRYYPLICTSGITFFPVQLGVAFIFYLL